MNVLSLFDGMSCGQIALNKINIKYDNYFASEIDKYAIKITQKNYPDTIQIGDITKVSYQDGVLKTENEDFNIGKIDLLMGGSPCQGFSLCSTKRLNFEDPRSKLFFEYVRLLKECNPTYYLLENVVMDKKNINIINGILNKNPTKINSALVSAQNRHRLYWTNIKNVDLPKDKGLVLKDVLDKDFAPERYRKFKKEHKIVLKDNYAYADFNNIESYANRAFYKESKTYSLVSGSRFYIYENNNFRNFSPTEFERLQTVPDNYTEGVSNAQRYKMLGNGWTVDVICHILKNMKL